MRRSVGRARRIREMGRTLEKRKEDMMSALIAVKEREEVGVRGGSVGQVWRSMMKSWLATGRVRGVGRARRRRASARGGS